MHECGLSATGLIMTENEGGVSEVLKGVVLPLIHWEKFAELVGIEAGVLRGMLDKGHIPSMKIGRHRFVNVARMNQIALRAV